MKRKIFCRFFAVTLVSVLLMFAFGVVAVNLNTKSTVRERLAEETELAATLLNESSDFALFSRYETTNELRITVLDLNGNVLYESDTHAELENHADREEIKNALAGTPATVERYSDTFQCEMTYYATKTALDDGSEVILRLAVRSSRITSYITVAIPLLIAVLIASLIISFVISGVFSRSVSSKVTEIGSSLKSLNEGKYVPIKTDMSEQELFAVLNEINELNSNIHSHIRIAEQEKSKLNTVLDNVSQSILAVDANRKIVFANKSAFTLFCGTPRDIGCDLVYLIEKLELYEKIVEHIEEDYAFTCSYDEKELSVAIVKITDDAISDDISAILIVTDITKEKLIEKQKSDFFANASHELKTPITVMQGLSEVLLNKESIDESSKKQIARIYKESMRLGSLIADMLKLSKLEGGDVRKKSASEVDLSAVANEAVGEWNEEIERKQVSVQVTGSGKVFADPDMMYELIGNLLSNAVKYNRNGGNISIAISETEQTVYLKVQDSGIGIEKEHLPRLCERFYRVDKSHSKRIGGTGLGLAIVKHICAVYNAKLTIESEFGLGTTVTVAFAKETP